jgi:tetratricopeptide (TPR) repeat protein
MSKQILLAAVGLLTALLLFFFGRTKEQKAAEFSTVPSTTGQELKGDIVQSLLKGSIDSFKLAFIDSLENTSIKGDSSYKILTYNKLIAYCKDSASSPLLYGYYHSKAAKLVNSEKSLTFAAQLILDLLRSEKNEKVAVWLTSEAVELFRLALTQSPANDDLKIGLGSVYIFGKSDKGGPEETMKGIQQILEVVRRDSNNMKAQLMLGIGGFVSGQYPKAEVRLLKVLQAQPDNLEAAAFLADTYAMQGKKNEAVKWYNISKRLANNSAYSKEVDARIEELK